MRIRPLQPAAANERLAQIGLTIGEWNELADRVTGASVHFSFAPSRDVSHVYALAHRLAASFSESAWALVQFDHSTAPSPDEVRTFEALVFEPNSSWDLDTQRAFLFERSSQRPADDLTSLTMTIFFAITFYWHVYIAFDGAEDGRRVGLQDGIVYFIGDERFVQLGKAWAADFERDPLPLAPPRQSTEHA
jgi:hypothetical protein